MLVWDSDLQVAALGTQMRKYARTSRMFCTRIVLWPAKQLVLAWACLWFAQPVRRPPEMLAYAHDAQHEKIIRYAIGCLFTNKF